jgi:ABC-type multidrug transport system ATPase subunit/pSer/pThr/pTyr-binding forkhead associated (FHA) protein
MSETCTFPLDGRTITLGRDPSCDVALTGMGVSRRHASVTLVPSACVITDLESTFGLRANGAAVRRHTIADSDVIAIGVRLFKVSLSPAAISLVPFSEQSSAQGPEPGGAARTAGDGSAVTIGRDPEAALSLPHPLVSRRHATLARTPGGAFTITDHHSANGTFVNGTPVSHGAVGEGDIIQVGPYRLFIENGRLVRADDSNRIRLEAVGVTVRTRRGRTLLDRATIAVGAGEFAVVLGPSGAGKSTLVRSLCGRQKIDGGAIYANRLPLKQFLAAFTANIGYVAQENLLHAELTVAETMREQSLIRLPADSTSLEREARISEVVTLLELEGVLNRRVSRCSGGEAKRVHLGVELLASPALIVLDEPLAGLDPGLVRRFMQLFRRIGDRGHTLLMTTHTLEQIELCDRLIFMHRGRVVFSGQPSELEPFFGTRTLADVYERVGQGTLPPLPSPGNEADIAPKPLPESKRRKPHTISFVRQFAMLTSRYARIMRRDRRTGALLLLQAPLIAVFLGFVFTGGSQFLPASFFFCVTISAVWMSGVNAAVEIAREWLLLDREFRAGLSLGAYLCAKAAVVFASALVQALLFWLFLGALFTSFPLTPEVLLLIAAGTVSGAVLGLCVSACSGTVGRAVTALPIIFIPQIFFSGILIPFDRMTDMGRALSYCTVARPVFSLFKHTCILGLPLFENPVWTDLCFLNLGLIILLAIAVRWRLARMTAFR